MKAGVLLLTPSQGLGGGIERYAQTLEWALTARAVGCRRLDLERPGLLAHARLEARARRSLESSPEGTRLVAVHRALLPVTALLAKHESVSGISLICHGGDVWRTASGLRPRIESWLMRRADTRVVAVSSFTAGFMHNVCPATVLPPGLSGSWFQTLVGASAAAQPWNQGAELVTAFRLADWRSKGLPELLAAVAALGRVDVCVTVCGSGEASADLRRLVDQYEWCRLRPGLSDYELAEQLAAADLFVLATRTKFGRRPSGEGFGLVLLEAQVAGTPVVAPAYGGSHDTFVDGVTGLAPVDESAEALTVVLEELLGDRERLARMGKRAAEWARESFDPECYASRVVAKVL